MDLDQKQIKAIMFTCITILMVLVIFILGVILIITGKEENTNINISIGFNSIKQIIEYYGCQYNNETYIKDREYPTQIDLKFKYDLYENNESNETFYNNIIKDIAEFLNYTNFKMVDTLKSITIEVICIEGRIYTIVINGIEDYFIYMDSQLEITKFKEIEPINIIPEAPSLLEIINNNWESNTNIGTRESIYNKYNIFFEEGIEYRKIGSKIYNIIYTDKYMGPVINGLNVGIDIKEIEDFLGRAPFKDEELQVIGYKSNDIYVFFTNDKISIYRYIEYDNDEFWKLCDRFLKDELDFKKFMNELTYLWRDYSEYIYNSDYMFISYPNRGIDVKLNYEEISGIVIYNNFSENLNTIKKYLENTEFISRLKIDNVFEAEKRRIKEEKNIEKLYKDFEISIDEEMKENEEAINKKSYLFNYYMEKDAKGYGIKTYFISKENTNANRELTDPVDTFLWANDYNFIYSIYGRGIYNFNVITGIKSIIVEGEKDFKIKSFDGNILKYDDLEETQVIY